MSEPIPGPRTSPADAVSHSFLNRAEVERSETCACFRCLARFRPADVRLWTDTDDEENSAACVPTLGPVRGLTVVCPACDHPDVIGSVSGRDLSDESLRSLRRFWYGVGAPS